MQAYCWAPGAGLPASPAAVDVTLTSPTVRAPPDSPLAADLSASPPEVDALQSAGSLLSWSIGSAVDAAVDVGALLDRPIGELATGLREGGASRFSGVVELESPPAAAVRAVRGAATRVVGGA